MTQELKEQKFMELLRVSRMQEQMDMIMGKMTGKITEQQIDMFVSMQEEVGPEEEAIIQKLKEVLPRIVLDTLGSDFAAHLITLFTEAMSPHFTGKEVDHLIELYKDPLMQKMIDVSKVEMEGLMMGCFKYVETKLPELNAKVEDAMKDLI